MTLNEPRFALYHGLPDPARQGEFYRGVPTRRFLAFLLDSAVVGLITLLVTTQRGSTRGLQNRTVIYRIVEAVGRWSMIDIFMISILVALVQLGELATIEPGIGAVSFAAVVIITMIAAMTFDPRLMWDAAGANHDQS